MKLRNLLLTAALFVSAGIVFAGNPHKTTSSVEEFFSLEKEEGMKSMYVTMFRMDNGWTYDINGYSDADNSVKIFSSELKTKKGPGITIASTPPAAKAYAATLENVPDDVKEGLEGHAIGVYQFEVLIPENVVSITLDGGKGKGNFTESIYDAATNGNDFWAIGGEDGDGILYFGKSNWIGSYNNGAVFLISGKKADTMGSPLPAPVVTLLIALGFGAALVMYRNRKAKA